MKRVIPIVLVLTAIVAGGYFYLRWTAPEPEAILKISGNIEAHESVVGFRVPGRIVDLPVEEGQYLKQGELIARLDDEDYQQQVKVDEATVAMREAELALALAGSRTQEIKAAEQTLRDAQADLKLKRLQYQRRYEAASEKRAVSGEDRDIAATELQRAQATYER